MKTTDILVKVSFVGNYRVKKILKILALIINIHILLNSILTNFILNWDLE